MHGQREGTSHGGLSMQFDRAGKPITLLDWVMKVGDVRYREIRRTETQDATVVTCWVGVPHGYDQQERPIIFETTVYSIGRPSNTRHYPTEADAAAGHEQECQRMREHKQANSDD